MPVWQAWYHSFMPTVIARKSVLCSRLGARVLLIDLVRALSCVGAD